MSFDWNKLYDIAAYCYENQAEVTCFDKEAIFRSIINRAYYSAYNQAYEFAILQFGTIANKGNGSHEKLINTYKHEANKSNDKRLKIIATALDRIKQNRVDADYQSKISNYNEVSYSSTVHFTIMSSKKIISIITELKNA